MGAVVLNVGTRDRLKQNAGPVPIVAVVHRPNLHAWNIVIKKQFGRIQHGQGCGGDLVRASRKRKTPGINQGTWYPARLRTHEPHGKFFCERCGDIVGRVGTQFIIDSGAIVGRCIVISTMDFGKKESRRKKGGIEVWKYEIWAEEGEYPLPISKGQHPTDKLPF